MILKTLLQTIDLTLERIEASQPYRYETLQRSLSICDVSVSRDYRKRSVSVRPTPFLT